MLVSDKTTDVITKDGGEFGHGFTYSGHPIACAAALATLSHRGQNFVTRVAEDVGPYLQSKWRELEDHPIVGHVRELECLDQLSW